MAESDAIWVDVLPSMSKFFPTFSKEAKASSTAAGASAGTSFASQFNASGSKLLKHVGSLIGIASIAEAGKALFGLGKTYEDTSNKIRVMTGATGSRLNSLVASTQNVGMKTGVSFDKISDAVGGLNQRLGLTGKPLENLALQEIRLSSKTGVDLNQTISTTTKMFEDWGIKTADQSTALDELFRASQSSGASVTDLSADVNKHGATMRELGFTYAQSLAMFAQFDRGGVQSDIVIAGMRKSIANLAKQGKDAPAAFQGYLTSIKNAKTQTEATKLAVQDFGTRAGPGMAAAVREGRLNITDLYNTIKNGKDTLSKAGADTATFSQKWQLLKNQLSVLLMPAMGAVMTKVTDMSKELSAKATPAIMRFRTEWGNMTGTGGEVRTDLDKLGSSILAVTGFLGRHLTAVKNVTIALAAMLAITKSVTAATAGLNALKTLGGLFTTGISGVTSFVGGVKMLGPALKNLPGTIQLIRVALVQMNLSLLASPWTWVVLGVVALGAALVVAYKKSATFRSVVNGALNGVVSVAKSVGAWFSGPFVGFFTGIPAFFSRVWGDVKSAFSAGINAVIGFVKTQWPVIIGALTGPIGLGVVEVVKHWTSVKAGFSAGFTAIKGVFTTGVNAITGLWSKAWNTIRKTWAFQVLNSLFSLGFRALKLLFTTSLNGLKVIWSAVWGWMRSFVTTEWNGIKVIVHGAMTLVRNYIVPVLNGIKAIWNSVWHFLGSVASSVWNGISSVTRRVWNAVVGWIVARLAALRNTWNAGWSAVRNFVTPIWNTISGVIHRVLGAIVAWFSGRVAAIKSVWTSGFNSVRNVASSIMNTVHNNIRAGMSKIAGAFKDGVAAFGSAWNGLKSVASKPIKFVLNTVINHGVIGGLRWIESKLGAALTPYLPKSVTSGWRSGGYTGAGDPDEVAGPVHKDEYVFDSDSVHRAGGPAALDRARAGLRQGRFPVGPAAAAIGLTDQNAPTPIKIPSALTRVLPTNVARVIAKGPGRDAKGVGSAGQDAVARGENLAKTGGWLDRCLAFVNRAWARQIAKLNVATARQAMNSVPRRLDGTPPPGAAMFWDTGNSAGHVSLSVGDGTTLSTDIMTPGWVSRVSDSLIGTKWGAKYMGWWSPDGEQPNQSASWLSKLKGLMGTVGGGIASAWDGVKSFFGGLSSPMEWLKSKLAGPIKSVAQKFGSSDFVKMAARVPQVALSAALKKAESIFNAFNGSGTTASGSAVQMGQQLAAARGWTGAQWSALYQLWEHESNWDPRANNASSGAYGIPQALPGSKMASAGADWRTNPKTQIDWGLGYIASRYGTPAKAWSTWQARSPHWYEHGTTSAVPGLAFLGENGLGELVTSPQARMMQGGEQVFSSADTRRILGGASGNLQFVSGTVDLTEDSKVAIYGWAVDALDDRDAANKRRGV